MTEHACSVLFSATMLGVMGGTVLTFKNVPLQGGEKICIWLPKIQTEDMKNSIYKRYHGRASISCCYCLIAKLCLTLCDPMDCSLPGSSIHGIFQARIL